MKEEYLQLIHQILKFSDIAESSKIYKKKYELLASLLTILLDCQNNSQKFTKIEELILLLLYTYKKKYIGEPTVNEEPSFTNLNDKKMLKKSLKDELMIKY